MVLLELSHKKNWPTAIFIYKMHTELHTFFILISFHLLFLSIIFFDIKRALFIWSFLQHFKNNYALYVISNFNEIIILENAYEMAHFLNIFLCPTVDTIKFVFLSNIFLILDGQATNLCKTK